MGPGMSPNTALDPAGLTLVNENGETHTYSWEKETPPRRPAAQRNRTEFPRMRPDLNRLDFSSMALFAKSYLDMIRHLDLSTENE